MLLSQGAIHACSRADMNIRDCSTVDPVPNDLASARQKKSLVTESRWSQE